MHPDLFKRNYHPLIILFYSSGMLSQQQLKLLPKTTKHNWNKFSHDKYYGYSWAKSYIEQFDAIKDVFASSFLFKTIRFMVEIRKGYLNMLQELTHNKNLLKLHANNIIDSIGHMVLFAKVKVTTACKFYGVSKDWYYTEKRKIVCSFSPLQSCYKQQPTQLTFKEVTTIERIISDATNYGKTKTTLYYQAMRGKLLFCAKSTFCKYATALGYKKPTLFKTKKKKGFRAHRVFEWLHVDITNVQTLEDGVQKVAFIKDNKSKAILHYGSTNGKAGSEFIKTLFQETFDKYKLFDKKDAINILSDGGPENKGELLSWIKNIKAPPVVFKITAQTADFPFSNSMSESTHSIYKTEFLHGKNSLNRKTHLKDLERFVGNYNYKRFPTELYGLNPMEVIAGKIPDKHRFKGQIKKAQISRIQTNQLFNNCTTATHCK